MVSDYKIEISGDHIVLKTDSKDANLKQYFCEGY